MRSEIELDAPPVARSILVLEGERLSMEQIENVKTQLQEALADETKWPLILCARGPVYWVAVDPPEETDEGSH